MSAKRECAKGKAFNEGKLNAKGAKQGRVEIVKHS